MEYLNDTGKLDYYIKKYHIGDLFSDHLFEHYYKYMSMVRFTKDEYIFITFTFSSAARSKSAISWATGSSSC